MASNGKTANETGRNAEKLVDSVMDIVRNKGYGVSPQHRFSSSEINIRPLTSNTIRVDFFVTGILGYETGLIFSVKRQDEGGTKQDGVYYEVDYRIGKVYPYPTILIITGEAWHPNLISYINRLVGTGNLLNVFSYEGLLRWAEGLPKVKPENMLEAIKTLPMFKDMDFGN